jgi:hypothetical protein
LERLFVYFPVPEGGNQRDQRSLKHLFLPQRPNWRFCDDRP